MSSSGKKVTPEEQAALNQGMIPIGFYVSIQEYKQLQELARRLYNEQGKDEHGNIVRTIPVANVNEVVRLATDVFKYNYTAYETASQEAGGPEKMIQGLLSMLQQQGVKLQ